MEWEPVLRLLPCSQEQCYCAQDGRRISEQDSCVPKMSLLFPAPSMGRLKETDTLYLPDTQRQAGAWKSCPAKACISALNLEGPNPIINIIVVIPVVAVKDLLCCACTARPKHYSGTHSHSHTLQAHNPSTAEALEFVGCPPISHSWDNLALQQQGYFLKKRVLCSEIDFWQTLVGHYWNLL